MSILWLLKEAKHSIKYIERISIKGQNTINNNRNHVISKTQCFKFPNSVKTSPRNGRFASPVNVQSPKNIIDTSYSNLHKSLSKLGKCLKPAYHLPEIAADSDKNSTFSGSGYFWSKYANKIFQIDINSDIYTRNFARNRRKSILNSTKMLRSHIYNKRGIYLSMTNFS